MPNRDIKEVQLRPTSTSTHLPSTIEQFTAPEPKDLHLLGTSYLKQSYYRDESATTVETINVGEVGPPRQIRLCTTETKPKLE